MVIMDTITLIWGVSRRELLYQLIPQNILSLLKSLTGELGKWNNESESKDFLFAAGLETRESMVV